MKLKISKREAVKIVDLVMSDEKDYDDYVEIIVEEKR